MWSMYRYVDTKRIEAKNKRFDQFHRVFDWVAGRTADGQYLTDVHQAMAIYQLSEFPEYKDYSLPIINYYLDKSGTDPDDSLFRKPLLYSRKNGPIDETCSYGMRGSVLRTTSIVPIPIRAGSTAQRN